MSQKFTFKKMPKSRGLASIGEASVSIVKLGGKEVGQITGPSWSSPDNLYRVRLAKKAPTDNAPDFHQYAGGTVCVHCNHPQPRPTVSGGADKS